MRLGEGLGANEPFLSLSRFHPRMVNDSVPESNQAQRSDEQFLLGLEARKSRTLLCFVLSLRLAKGRRKEGRTEGRKEGRKEGPIKKERAAMQVHVRLWSFWQIQADTRCDINQGQLACNGMGCRFFDF